MAKFKKRGNTWTYYVYLGIDPLTKKRIEMSKGGFRTEKEAKAAARIVELQKDNGTLIRESNMSFEMFAQDWLKLYVCSGVKVSSVRAREKEMKHFIKGLIKLVRLQRKCMKSGSWN
jgi:hypothetical protein